MPELLLEVLSEEIPARMQAQATADLRRLVTEKLKEAGLEFNASEAFATPRRLMMVVDGLTVRTEDLREERRGPKVGAPEKALEGFCRGNGVEPGDLEQRDTPQGIYYYAIVEKAGEDTADVLPGLLGEALQALPWPKSMRWADLPGRWVRPIHGLLAIFNGAVLDLSIGDAEATNKTRGHRFMAPDSFEVTSFLNYKKLIRAAHVIIDPLERRTSIKKGAQALAVAANCTVQEDDSLLDEVSGLVEWPVPLM
ncbi:MAG: glycine--tRNA ligase subunit beta, partial [Proteobacteria bacterium]|nr:glycine--tRNA ligase subunit beta [Pseudomonadota bacterium]